MRVLCIHGGKRTVSSTGSHVEGPIPVVGNYYIVISDIVNDDELFYELAEFPRTTDRIDYFSSKMFAVPSSIDETEIVKEREVTV